MDENQKVEFLVGLEVEPKYISSKFFYDDRGSKIFQEIMAMPDYYLTESEFEILKNQGEGIYQALNFKEHFNIVELGPGDGVKTFNFLEYLVELKINFTYIPIDISSQAINMLVEGLNVKLPGLDVNPMVGDYFEVLKNNKEHSTSPNLLLFLGSNIGNYTNSHAVELLKLFHVNMKKGDKLLIGMDLRKNPIFITEAYYDRYGITKRFNLNLITRMNEELGANAIASNFDFYCYYDPIRGEVKSYIVSLKQQDVTFKEFNKIITFKRNELIWTEVSKKYSFEEIEELAKDSDFKVLNNFLDSNRYFTDSLWVK